ncbi:MAG: GNAT family N-acetyltransferase [Rhizobiaceae bacterium]|nr:GNAT family N-acetyltransferase [Rhizobiaceae bacterium]
MTDKDISIRIARPEDQATLTQLIGASYAMLDNGRYDAAQLMRALPLMSKANPRLLASGTYFIAEVDGVAASCGGWSFEMPGSRETSPGVAYIRHFATHPEYLRLGLARRLITRCLEEAAAKGAGLIKCQSTLQAERFYASAGFRSVGQIDVEMGPGVTLPVMQMERTLG